MGVCGVGMGVWRVGMGVWYGYVESGDGCVESGDVYMESGDVYVESRDGYINVCLVWVRCTGEFHCSMCLEPMYTVLPILPGISFPPTMMMSPPSRLIAAALNFGFGRVPLVIVSHELVLGKYLWTAVEE